MSGDRGKQWLSPAVAELVLRRARPIPTAGLISSTPVTDVAGEDLNGDPVLLPLSGADAPLCTVLVFLSASCAGCADLWSLLLPGQVARIAKCLPRREPAGGHEIAAVGVTRTPSSGELVQLKNLAPKGSTVVVSDDAWEAYGVHSAPFFVVTSRGDTRVRSEGVAWGAESVARHVASALG